MLCYATCVLCLFAGLYLHAVTESKLVVDTSRGETLRINVMLFAVSNLQDSKFPLLTLEFRLILVKFLLKSFIRRPPAFYALLASTGLIYIYIYIYAYIYIYVYIYIF